MIETYVQDRIECHHMKIDDTLVSIVLPVLNSAQYLEQSLRNCLNQSHRAVELIIVDGGSSDSTLEICRQYSDSRIRVIEQSDNRGKLPGALNLGFSMAKETTSPGRMMITCMRPMLLLEWWRNLNRHHLSE